MKSEILSNVGKVEWIKKKEKDGVKIFLLFYWKMLLISSDKNKIWLVITSLYTKLKKVKS